MKLELIKGVLENIWMWSNSKGCGQWWLHVLTDMSLCGAPSPTYIYVQTSWDQYNRIIFTIVLCLICLRLKTDRHQRVHSVRTYVSKILFEDGGQVQAVLEVDPRLKQLWSHIRCSHLSPSLSLSLIHSCSCIQKFKVKL
jgi:hypothetical protein